MALRSIQSIHFSYPFVPELRVTGVCWRRRQLSYGEGSAHAKLIHLKRSRELKQLHLKAKVLENSLTYLTNIWLLSNRNTRLYDSAHYFTVINRLCNNSISESFKYMWYSISSVQGEKTQWLKVIQIFQYYHFYVTRKVYLQHLESSSVFKSLVHRHRQSGDKTSDGLLFHTSLAGCCSP